MPQLPLRLRRIAVFAGIFVLVLLVIEFNSRLEELNRVNAQLKQVRALATQAMQTQISFQTEVAYAQSNAAVEEWARTEGYYLREGDRPVIPVGQPGSAPVIMETSVPTPTPLQNWEVWWALFFGSD